MTPKQKFLNAISKTNATVLWAKFFTIEEGLQTLSPSNASDKEEWDYFLKRLDYNYDLWCAHSSGTIMFSDDSWAQYNNKSGNWDFNKKPSF